MGVVVACLRCGAQLRSKDEFIGKLVRCPYCHTINQLPDRPNTVSLEVDAQVCPICTRAVEAHDNSVKGPQGVVYHRECFEIERARWRSQQAARAASPSKTPPQPLRPPASLTPSQPLRPPTPSRTPPQPLRPPTSSSLTPSQPLRPPATPAQTPSQPLPPPPTAPATGGSSSTQLAPLEWSSDLRTLLDEWEAFPPGGLLEPRRAFRWRWLRRNSGLGKLLILLLAFAVPCLVVAVAAYVFFGNPRPGAVPAQPDTAAGPLLRPTNAAGQELPEGYAAIAGMDLWLPIPSGFVEDADLPGLTRSSDGVTVVVSKAPLPFADIVAGITSASIHERGLELLQRREMTIAHEPGLLIQVRSGQGKASQLQWIAIFGTAERTYSIVATFPEEDEDRFSEAMRRTLLAARYAGPPPAVPEPTP